MKDFDKSLQNLGKFHREQVDYWREQERRWKEVREFCHRKVLEIRAIRLLLRTELSSGQTVLEVEERAKKEVPT